MKRIVWLIFVLFVCTGTTSVLADISRPVKMAAFWGAPAAVVAYKSNKTADYNGTTPYFQRVKAVLKNMPKAYSSMKRAEKVAFWASLAAGTYQGVMMGTETWKYRKALEKAEHAIADLSREESVLEQASNAVLDKMYAIKVVRDKLAEAPQKINELRQELARVKGKLDQSTGRLNSEKERLERSLLPGGYSGGADVARARKHIAWHEEDVQNSAKAVALYQGKLDTHESLQKNGIDQKLFDETEQALKNLNDEVNRAEKAYGEAQGIVNAVKSTWNTDATSNLSLWRFDLNLGLAKNWALKLQGDLEELKSEVEVQSLSRQEQLQFQD